MDILAGSVRAGVQSLTEVQRKVNQMGNTDAHRLTRKETLMNSIIYIVGLVVVVIAVMSFFGLR